MSRDLDIEALTRPGGLVPVDIETTAGLVREVERLRNGIQDWLAGNFPNPRDHRPDKCGHGRYWYEGCEACDTEHFERLLKPATQTQC